MNIKDKREHKRYVVDAVCEIKMECACITGELKNISFSGFFMKTKVGLSAFVGGEADVKITTRFNDHDYCITARSRIIRSDENGVGCFFVGMDDINIEAFNNLILNLSLNQTNGN
ncbi:MAG: PilZ domain-containing protein [Gammaproteobacteria bacterium]|nr:PilZ domain-containing protein [Gammaproteobacteria bacterium]MDH5594155.1 PilZ domain-containing protein [Gammaproteobacteria bacterium]MDH5613618.1 PilZ domain-containing protein [Gammaproteobacteria bacterium]